MGGRQSNDGVDGDLVPHLGLLNIDIAHACFRRDGCYLRAQRSRDARPRVRKPESLALEFRGMSKVE